MLPIIPRRPGRLLGAAVVVVATASPVGAETRYLDRLPAERLDATPPSALVSGPPGRMSVRFSGCRDAPSGEIRRRIVDLAIQEWGFFGFPIVDRTVEPPPRPRSRIRWWRRPVDPGEGARLAATIAGYWAATPEGAWMVERQNTRWQGPDGLGARWRDAWSAAFISWVMCEAGLDRPARFRRAIAHHVYVDQAIRARDAASPEAAFRAFDPGETALGPGDLLCTSRRNSYRSVAQRRSHLGVNARMHCDIVVALEPDRERILAIGGNVRGTVSLKLLPARLRGERLVPDATEFAHLKLQAEAIEDDALRGSPTLDALEASPGVRVPPALANLLGSRPRATDPNP